MNRLKGNTINNDTNDQEDMMVEIMETLKDTVTPIPDVGMYCTFVYNAKSPNIKYDQHPLIAVTDVFSWGFRGINFHHQESRQYTWSEVAGQVYIVNPKELDDLLKIPYGKMIINK